MSSKLEQLTFTDGASGPTLSLSSQLVSRTKWLISQLA